MYVMHENSSFALKLRYVESMNQADTLPCRKPTDQGKEYHSLPSKLTAFALNANHNAAGSSESSQGPTRFHNLRSLRPDGATPFLFFLN
jgi:hypothetical protein